MPEWPPLFYIFICLNADCHNLRNGKKLKGLTNSWWVFIRLTINQPYSFMHC